VAPAAIAAGSGSISGEVTEFAGKKGPLQGISVRAYRENGEFAGSATTGASGKYQVGALAGGNYKVEFSGAGFATQYYLGKSSFAEAEPVVVMEGVEKGGINAALRKLGRIAGTVTEAAGKKGPIPGLAVEVSNLAGEFVSETTTNAEGKYEVSGLPTGTYKVGFNIFGELNYVPQYYNNQPSFEMATLVPVQVEKTFEANAALQIGGEILGRVTDAGTGAPISNLLVSASKTEGFEGFGSAETNANGEYRIFGLATGLFRLEFQSVPGQVQYINQPRNVSVTQGRATAGINVALVRRAPFNTGAPVVSGVPAVGQMLSCSTGSWTGLQPLTFTYAWLRDGTVITGASGSIYVVQSADQAHTLRCRVTARNSASSASATSNALTVPPPPPPPPPAPTIESASQSNARWREGSRLAIYSRRRRAPVGTTFRFVLNQQAIVSFAFTQQVGGRKVNGRCVAQTRSNRRRPSCKRTVTQGTLSFIGHSGLNKVAFQGRISRSQRLPLGAYSLQITALNSAGKRSGPRTLNFTIVR
jgi:hypothetical protein